MSDEGRPPDRPDRGRRVRRRLQPAGTARGRAARRARRRRSSWSSRTGRARRSTGRASRGSTPRWSPAATTTLWRRRSPGRDPTSSCSPATCGSSVRACSPHSRPHPEHASLVAAGVPRRDTRSAMPSAHGVRLTGVTVHLVDATLDGGPIVAQEAVPVLPDDDEASLRDRIQAVEHRLLPQVVALVAADAVAVDPEGDSVAIDLDRADRAVRTPAPRAAVGVGQDRSRRPRSWPRRPRVRAGVDGRHGASAARRRPAGHRRRRRHRLPGDARRTREDAAPARACRAAGRPPPAPTIAGSSSPRASPRSSSSSSTSTRSRPRSNARASRSTSSSRRSTSAGRRWSEPRPRTTRTSRSSRHRRATATSSPRSTAGGVDDRLRRELALEAFAHTAAYDARIAVRASRPARRGRTARPPERSVSADAVDRPREGRDAALRREPAPAGGPLPAAGVDHRRRSLRRRARAAPGQGALVQQRARCGRRVGARPRAARARRS